MYVKETNLRCVNLVNMAQGWMLCQPPLGTTMNIQFL